MTYMSNISSRFKSSPSSSSGSEKRAEVWAVTEATVRRVGVHGAKATAPEMRRAVVMASFILIVQCIGYEDEGVYERNE